MCDPAFQQLSRKTSRILNPISNPNLILFHILTTNVYKVKVQARLYLNAVKSRVLASCRESVLSTGYHADDVIVVVLNERLCY